MFQFNSLAFIQKGMYLKRRRSSDRGIKMKMKEKRNKYCFRFITLYHEWTNHNDSCFVVRLFVHQYTIHLNRILILCLPFTLERSSRTCCSRRAQSQASNNVPNPHSGWWWRSLSLNSIKLKNCFEKMMRNDFWSYLSI